MGKTAIILGTTGLTGNLLLNDLLEDNSYDKLKLFSRSSVGIEHPKIEEHLIDLFELNTHSEKFTADVVFCRIGTTKAKTPDKETYRKIDYGIPVKAAELAKKNGIDTYIVVSAMGADAGSRIFYNKVKGEMEAAVLEQEIPNTYILQPSIIGGKRAEKRAGESSAKFVFRTFAFLIPKKYRMIAPEDIAKAMVILANEVNDKVRIPSDVIKKIANQY